MNNFRKNIIFWIFGFIFLTTLFNLFQSNSLSSDKKRINFSEFMSKIENKDIVAIKFESRSGAGISKDIEGVMKDGTVFVTYGGFDQSLLLESSYRNGVQIDINPVDNKGNILLNIFISWFPTILFIAVWIFFIKQMNGGGGKGAFGFGKSKAKLNENKTDKVTFADVAGIDEAKEDMFEIIEFLKDPIKFQKLGGKIPKGCLLVGSPGAGKTLLAKAIAGEANVPFFSISGSDFVEMFVGVGASRVRDMFEQAKKAAPCIIFIDEIDAIGKNRGSANFGGGNDEREQTLNQMLVEMDGFEKNYGIIVIAATNRPDVLDPALLRPGRFDRQILISNPDIKGREQILKLYLKKIKASENIDALLLARATPGFSGAELANLVNEGALRAAKLNKSSIEMIDLQFAKDKIMMGTQKKFNAMSDEERKLTAYHESGHALVALNVATSDPIYKVTIIPTNMALGMVVRLPEDDRFFMTKEKILDDIAVAMGGRAAEEIIFGANKITTGASSDIKAATSLAKNMVEKWGMSDNIGTLDYSKPRDIYQQNHYSDNMRQKIDDEITNIVKEGYERAKAILIKNKDDLEKLTTKLLEKETMTGQEVLVLLNKTELIKKSLESNLNIINETEYNVISNKEDKLKSKIKKDKQNKL
ncbi:MAG: ATP-dependent zinc metalloprotease FtsH, partial [Rickettsiales bacterium]